jgi:hypothetical protein
MMFRREEYLELMTFGRTGRPMVVELFGLLVGLDREWRGQGATDEEIALTAFDWDFVRVVPCAHTSVTSETSSRGTRLFDMDSDGNVHSILDSLRGPGCDTSMTPFPCATLMLRLNRMCSVWKKQ